MDLYLFGDGNTPLELIFFGNIFIEDDNAVDKYILCGKMKIRDI